MSASSSFLYSFSRILFSLCNTESWSWATFPQPLKYFRLSYCSYSEFCNIKDPRKVRKKFQQCVEFSTFQSSAVNIFLYYSSVDEQVPCNPNPLSVSFRRSRLEQFMNLCASSEESRNSLEIQREKWPSRAERINTRHRAKKYEMVARKMFSCDFI